MPSSMTHLLCAKLYSPNSETAFFVGNIAPDCIDIREFKDHTHFRDIPEGERLDALRALARTYDLSDPFFLGIVFHLFADYTWDTGPQREHRERYVGDNWFTDYRQEIHALGQEIYARYGWSNPLWSDMAALDSSYYSSAAEYPSSEIQRHILSGWHHARIPGENTSAIFTAKAVDAYCARTAELFADFLRSI